jgi:hypothetical protein
MEWSLGGRLVDDVPSVHVLVLVALSSLREQRFVWMDVLTSSWGGGPTGICRTILLGLALGEDGESGKVTSVNIPAATQVTRTTAPATPTFRYGDSGGAVVITGKTDIDPD